MLVLDFTTAFNSVDYAISLRKLAEYDLEKKFPF